MVCVFTLVTLAPLTGRFPTVVPSNPPSPVDPSPVGSLGRPLTFPYVLSFSSTRDSSPPPPLSVCPLSLRLLLCFCLHLSDSLSLCLYLPPTLSVSPLSGPVLSRMHPSFPTLLSSFLSSSCPQTSKGGPGRVGRTSDPEREQTVSASSPRGGSPDPHLSSGGRGGIRSPRGRGPGPSDGDPDRHVAIYHPRVDHAIVGRGPRADSVRHRRSDSNPGASQ